MFDVEKQIEQWRAGMAGSETLGNSTIEELEGHLREQIGDLKASGLSDEEAFLVARRRLGDTTALEEEFAKVRPHRQLIQRLFWMAAGILGYFLALYASLCVTNMAAALGYTAGLRNPLLAVLACVLHVAVFVGIGGLLWRYLNASASRAVTRRTPVSLRVGLCAACAVTALSFVSLLSYGLMFRLMPSQGATQVAVARGWAGIWITVMPFLLVGLIVLLVLRDRRGAEVR